MIPLLAWTGRHATALLLAGFLVVPVLPLPPGLFAPTLPALVVLVIGLGVARLPLALLLTDLTAPRVLGPVLLGLLLFQPVTALVLGQIGMAAGLAPGLMVLVIAFAAAPPLSSAPNLSLILGYDARTALHFTLIGTVLAPLLVPLCVWLAGLETGVVPLAIAGRVLLLLAAGLALGALIQWKAGLDRIRSHPQVFNGVATVAMLLFLFPLMDGVAGEIRADPLRVLELGGLALLLNLGGNLLVRSAAGRLLPAATARALGLLFGNRNISVLLAVLPVDPLLNLFVAVAQLPIYGTPLLFSTLDARRRPCPSSSES